MANYYYVTIKSDKMTQEVAAEILQEMATKNIIRAFTYHEGYLYYNTRSLTDISPILERAGFIDSEIDVKDEFDLVYGDNFNTKDEFDLVYRDKIEVIEF